MFARTITALALLIGSHAAIAQQRFDRGLVVARPLVSSGAPGAVRPQTRNVTLELRENGALVTRSQVRLRLGMVAAVPVDGPYAVRLRVDASGGGYMVRPTLSRVSGTNWESVPAPAIAAAQGEPASVTVDTAATPPVEIAVRVD